MGPIKAVAFGYTRMFNFSGRARRAEYWWFFVWQVLIGIAGSAAVGWQAALRAQADPAFAAMMRNPDAIEAYMISMLGTYALPLAVGYLLLFVIPNLSLTIRRLHDTNRSGWNIFMPTLVGIASGVVGGLLMGGAAAGGSAGGMMIGAVATIVPSLIASIVFLVWLCLPGTNGPNRFGGDPISNRKAPEPAHPAFAPQIDGEARDRAEVARKAAAHDYYKRRVLPSIQKA